MREYMLNVLRFQLSDEDAKRLGATPVEEQEPAAKVAPVLANKARKAPVK